MQELLGLVEQMFNNAETQEVELAMNDVINIITQEGMQKEKEHIEDALEVGWVLGCAKNTGDKYLNTKAFWNHKYGVEEK